MPTANGFRSPGWTVPFDGPSNCSITEAECVAEDVVARDGVDGGLALPALTAHFGADRGAVLLNRFGDRLRQIKIAANTAGIGTVHTEDRLGPVEIRRVFDLAVLGNAFGIVIAEVHDQRFQLGKFVREGGRAANALAFLLPVIEARSFFWSIHRVWSFFGFKCATILAQRSRAVCENRQGVKRRYSMHLDTEDE